MAGQDPTRKSMVRWFIFVFLLVNSFPAFSARQDGPLLQYNDGVMSVHGYGTLIDNTGDLKIQEVAHLDFKDHSTNIGNTKNTIWLKITVKNLSNADSLFLDLRNPSIFNVSFYTVQNSAIFNELQLGRAYPFEKRPIQGSLNFVYPFSLKKGDTASLFIRLYSDTPLFTPLFLSKRQYLEKENSNELLRIGIYLGVVLIMFLYHLFILMTINKEERDYFYIGFILVVGMSQLILNGFANSYIWPDSAWWSINGYNLAGIASGLATGIYTKFFLRTSSQAPKFNKLINVMIVLYLLCIPVHFVIGRYYAYSLINVFAVFGALLIIATAVYIKRSGYRPAQFFLGAFSVFLVAVILFVLRNMNIIAYNLATANILEIGSGLQIALLSFALADRINIYRREQQEAIKENERITKDYNIELEKKVLDRTVELSESNKKLKDAQIKLVDNEKMAALGQLTAGIAHEINNPINFVAANIKPLSMDIHEVFQVIGQYEKIDLSQDIRPQLQKIEDFKQNIEIKYLQEEIGTLIQGIREGASRTADIVSNLKNFARIDQSYMKYANLNEGIESTIVLVRNTFPKDLILKKELGAIPMIECEPGKINQVFMNIISNAVQAIKLKDPNPEAPKTLTIRTWEEASQVHISIKDSGKGMPETVKQRVFEPFFTTKPVGEGTGLGMSIVKSIIESHQGDINIISAEGVGTEFIISLPLHREAN